MKQKAKMATGIKPAPHNLAFNESAQGRCGKPTSVGNGNKAFNDNAPINHTNRPTAGQMVAAGLLK